MKSYGPLFCASLLILLGAISLACGSFGTLQSISVNPASADAKSYPDGQVQFTAMGDYSSSSSLSPVAVTWSTCGLPGGPPSEIAVSATGVAQCNPGASGTYVVEASHGNPPSGGALCLTVLACGQAGKDCLATHGVAHLTCP
jgi:hypothetical protein